MRRRILRLTIAFAVIAVLGIVALPYVRAMLFVVRAASDRTWAARVARLDTYSYRESTAEVPWRGGSLRARVYRPSTIKRAAILVHGINAIGIDEPRLVLFARELAASGLAVVTPEMIDLERYELTARTTDMIEDAAVWLAQTPDLAPDARVGLMGISFAGGLSVVAGGRPRLADRLAFVFAFGGHADYPRVLRYLCTGIEPSLSPSSAADRPTYRPPHDYGAAIILLGLAHRVVPPDQVAPLRDGILTFLRASHLDMFDKPQAQREFARAKTKAAALPEPAATLMSYVNTRNVKALGPRLLPLLDEIDAHPSLSPDRSPAPSAPVYLLHGTDDNVVPAGESRLMARYLEGKTPVRMLLSDLVTHAGVDRQHMLSEAWNVAAFWAAMMKE